MINREDSDEKGVCYPESKQTWVTLHHHISEMDLVNTSIEESVHQILSMFNLELISNVEQEEWFIEQMFWALNDWSLVD
ncbi:hypothetical protein OAU44_00055 [bacterium]|nr:hypothetical protein [bacterium]